MNKQRRQSNPVSCTCWYVVILTQPAPSVPVPWQLPDGPATSGADAHGSSVAACASPAGQGMPLAFGGVQLRSLERRVASMGGIPALGACVLPKMTPGQRPQLAATAGPAAVEIMRGRMGDSDATPLRRVGGDEEESAAPTPLVALRSTPAAAPKGGLGASPGGGAPPGSELAAAIARRMQRLGSASPEKDSAAAPPAAAAAEVSCDG